MVEKEENKNKEINEIQSPTEVSQLVRDLWINHKNGIHLPKNNVFIVNLPSIEKKEIETNNKE